MQIRAHSPRTFSSPRKRNCPESARLFDLSEYRFNDEFSCRIYRRPNLGGQLPFHPLDSASSLR